VINKDSRAAPFSRC